MAGDFWKAGAAAKRDFWKIAVRAEPALPVSRSRTAYRTERLTSAALESGNQQEALLITAGQLRAARALLRLDQRQFASLVHVPIGVVQRLERARGPLKTSPQLLEAIRTTLNDAGIELIGSGPYSGEGGPGVRLTGDVMVQVSGEPSLGEAAEAPLAVVA
jgi:DNA-binding transcriptional regulator YiaG